MDKITLIVADDHPIFLEGLCTLISMKYPEIEILGQGKNGLEAVELVRKHNPQAALLDIRMPEMDGLDAACAIRVFNKKVKLVMLTTFNESDLISKLLNAGINGYILKERPIPEVVENIKSIMKGNMVLTQKVADHLFEDKRKDASIPRFDKTSHLLKNLSSREKEVLSLILANYRNQTIAEKLFLSERTVRNYVSKIYEVIGVHNRESLNLWALENNLTGT